MREFERKLSKNKQKDKLNDFHEELFDIPPFSLNSSTSLSSNPSNSSRNADIDKQLQKKVQEKQSSVRKKVKVMELSSSEDEHDIVNELRLQIAEMHYELEQQQDYIEQLESERNTKIETFTDGRYTDELRE